MIVRRSLAGVLAMGLAVPLLAAASHDGRERKALAPPAPPPGMGTRVFARAESAAEPPPSPGLGAAPDGPGPASQPSPEIAARARTEFEANRAGKIDRTHYTAEMNGTITDAALRRASAELRALGAVKSFSQVRRITQGAMILYVFRIEMEKQPAVEEAIAWDAAGNVEFLRFGPVR